MLFSNRSGYLNTPSIQIAVKRITDYNNKQQLTIFVTVVVSRVAKICKILYKREVRPSVEGLHFNLLRVEWKVVYGMSYVRTIVVGRVQRITKLPKLTKFYTSVSVDRFRGSRATVLKYFSQ